MILPIAVVSEVESSSDEIDTTTVSESLSFLLPTANTCTSAIDFDIGSLTNDHVSPQDVETALKLGPKSNPNHFPKDCKGRRFPVNIFKYKLQNGDNSVRDWLVWSEARKALFCFSCRLFKSQNTVVGVSVLCSVDGWSMNMGWKKLYNRVPEHEHSISHRQCYLQWHTTERRLSVTAGVNMQLEKRLLSEMEKWREILKRVIDVVLFISERGLAFRGSSQRIGSIHNGNFLGIIELVSHYDPILLSTLRV